MVGMAYLVEDCVKYPQRHKSKQMQSADQRKWQGQDTLGDGTSIDLGLGNILLRDRARGFLALGLGGIRARGDTGLGVRVVAGPHPQRDRHDSKIACNQHGTRQICSDADETVRLHEQVEEETLV